MTAPCKGSVNRNRRTGINTTGLWARSKPEDPISLGTGATSGKETTNATRHHHYRSLAAHLACHGTAADRSPARRLLGRLWKILQGHHARRRADHRLPRPAQRPADASLSEGAGRGRKEIGFHPQNIADNNYFKGGQHAFIATCLRYFARLCRFHDSPIQ